jgi:hypothetical protein
MDLREIRCDGIDWIDVAQERDHWRAGNLLSRCTIGGFSKRPQLHE